MNNKTIIQLGFRIISGADIYRICVELCAFGLKASYLVKMLPFLH